MKLETETVAIEKQLIDLRSRISDLSHEIDTQKAKTAAAMGAGVFLFLLALLGVYDLMSGKGTLWVVVGATQSMLYWLTGGLAAASVVLFISAFVFTRGRNPELEARLETLQDEYARLLDRKERATE